MLGRTGILDGANRPYRWDLVRPDQLGTLVERAGDADLLRDWISLDWPVWHYFGDVQAKLTASFPPAALVERERQRAGAFGEAAAVTPALA
ncbi:hypothetical protein ACFWMR_29405 [Amycolatopsis thailandensis]|uniref:hypothetical protein n=1 Tax=Amycolatopsis thailandensis TaxID=589330 RepID=UPI0036466A40